MQGSIHQVLLAHIPLSLKSRVLVYTTTVLYIYNMHQESIQLVASGLVPSFVRIGCNLRIGRSRYKPCSILLTYFDNPAIPVAGYPSYPVACGVFVHLYICMSHVDKLYTNMKGMYTIPLLQ
jgi:hypothetical protein